MRKPRDYDAELKALDQRARALRTKQRDQLGELVIATGAHALPLEILTGALLATVSADAGAKEAWRLRGAAFFRGNGDAAAADRRNTSGAAKTDDRAQSASGTTGAL